ncbi:hypothetical protein BofuT4_P057510.1 [Botrytis cinerea T4]|uniref:Uncharacterized protein n=1 Tax=Botryotinia fuckeliana (strain T4) TaxID=999810 RepID=G2XUK1_BOTF4|nr:hypothetical protein BofuT4_P057510.1 [Botrytis cinerea T4]
MLCLLAKKHPLLTLVIVQKDHREVGATSMRMEHRMMLFQWKNRQCDIEWYIDECERRNPLAIDQRYGERTRSEIWTLCYSIYAYKQLTWPETVLSLRIKLARESIGLRTLSANPSTVVETSIKP